MKLRTGFVSNSSSASYIVNIDISYEDFITKMFEEFLFGYVNHIIGYLDNEIEQTGLKLEEYKESKHHEVLKFMYNREMEEMDKLVNYKNKCLKIDKDNPTVEDKELMLKIFFDRIEFFENEIVTGKIVTVRSSTAMHNNVGDVPKGLKDIIVYCMSRKIPVTFEVDED